jgi:xanthine dehydrogenase large subunit
MKANPESLANLRGQTRYIDDLPEPAGCLQAALRLSGSPHGRIISMDAEAAKALDPSVIVLTAADVPGENQIGGNKPDEPLLPEGEWEYWGQPLVLVLAKTRALARRAAAAVVVAGEDLPFRLDPREAAAAGDFILPSRTIACGDPAAAFGACAHVVSGRVDSGGQEHVYLETQGAYAERREGGKIFLVSSTQGPTGVQKAVARALGLAMNKVEVEAHRLGGGFGGKEDQAATWAALAALGSWVSGKPVKLYLNRRDDMRATGKRHPYTTDFKIGADSGGKILAFEADYYQNSGCTCDLSPAILSRTVLHATGAYRVPNVRVTGMMCRTNLPSFTAFRGFGAPQAFFVVESAIDAMARAMGRPREEIQRANLFREGDSTYFGMPMVGCKAEEAWDALLEKADWKGLKAGIEAYNASERLSKKGAAIIPVAFGISFTKLPMNEAGALVHVYSDGSVLVSTGAVEMGQQVARKIGLVVARSLGLPLERISVERTSTQTVANTVPTAASTGSDLNGMAAKIACEQILARLSAKAGEILGVPAASISFADALVLSGGAPTELSWNKLVEVAFESRVDLSAHGFYATPNLFYDGAAERGRPFAYYVYGAACVTARVDLVLGRASLESATIVHDSGTSLDQEVDLGQIEGAFAQGLGWTLLEDLRFGEDGRPLTDSLSTYKLPDASFMPHATAVEFLPPGENPFAPFNSKAVGEPPLQYGIAAYFAVLDALRAAKPEGEDFYSIPLIPEKIEAFLSGAKPC